MKIPLAQQQAFLIENGLPIEYLEAANTWFEPFANAIIQQSILSDVPLVIGINGCQGSGKTTFAEYLVLMLNAAKVNTMNMSMDDFYLTRSQRNILGSSVHPLLKTRGVPGTHDVNLLLDTLSHLKQGHHNVAVPKFNKALDDRAPQQNWPVYSGPFDVIILEGWCLAVPAQTQEELLVAVNELELMQDPEGIWRQYVNQALLHEYSNVWEGIDYTIMLKAPSFNCVYQWRWQQEQKLLEKTSDFQASKGLLSQDTLKVFIQYFERLTTHALKTVPELCQHVFYLDEQREVVKYEIQRRDN